MTFHCGYGRATPQAENFNDLSPRFGRRNRGVKLIIRPSTLPEEMSAVSACTVSVRTN
ncbi:hypothetical protein [Paramicrobacterium agarici]|uniref:hypothetical protein n=1 Tax=Paramicrobacterium agarici TaxID=630514 RepID=UPI00116F534F|nr:hypothetical protein [Microbacterium agarici]TQO24160.1 hypothetical protein FB385_3036 [Microbacterium agarici]